ncbi:hypothetical protein [Demequina sp. NBRC 110055]|uniref:hypothetical protein n=1 Tax=Demequina sp. NBRC 110055 TaxID=1570344 RepID=UPI0009FCE263|nr:hypothetical protein [Demequina sp. NBRC 110055]
MTLKAEREAIADALTTAGLKGWAWVPEAPVAPCAIVQPGSPYLTADGATFCGYHTRYLVSVLARVGTNEKVTDDLDQLIELACQTLTVTEVSEPFALTFNTANYYAVNLTVTGSISL